MTTSIVFDFGAVLFGWRPDLLVAQRFARQAATPHAAQVLARAIFHHADWLSFDRGVLDLPVVVDRTATRLGLPRADLADLMSGIGEYLTPIPETLDLLARLRRRRQQADDLRLFYLSNMPAPFARVLERRHDFLRWFDGGVFSGDVGLLKPEPAIFALLESRHALVPQQAIFIDDSAANVDAARARGWRAIEFRSADQLAADLHRLIN